MLLPQMVVQDGYFVSHIAGEVEMPAAAQVDAYLPPYRLPFPLDPRRPVSHGPQIHPSQGPPLPHVPVFFHAARLRAARENNWAAQKRVRPSDSDALRQMCALLAFHQSRIRNVDMTDAGDTC